MDGRTLAGVLRLAHLAFRLLLAQRLFAHERFVFGQLDRYL